MEINVNLNIGPTKAMLELAQGLVGFLAAREEAKKNGNAISAPLAASKSADGQTPAEKANAQICPVSALSGVEKVERVEKVKIIEEPQQAQEAQEAQQAQEPQQAAQEPEKLGDLMEAWSDDHLRAMMDYQYQVLLGDDWRNQTDAKSVADRRKITAYYKQIAHELGAPNDKPTATPTEKRGLFLERIKDIMRHPETKEITYVPF